jgi:hypothetical protein
MVTRLIPHERAIGPGNKNQISASDEETGQGEEKQRPEKSSGRSTGIGHGRVAVVRFASAA